MNELTPDEIFDRTQAIDQVERKVSDLSELHGWTLSFVSQSASSLSRYFDCFRPCQICSYETIRIRISDHYSHGYGCDFSFFPERKTEDFLAELESRLKHRYPDQLDPARVAETMDQLVEYEELCTGEAETRSADEWPSVTCPRCNSSVEIIDPDDIESLRTRCRAAQE